MSKHAVSERLRSLGAHSYTSIMLLLVLAFTTAAFSGCGNSPRLPIVTEAPNPEPEQNPDPVPLRKADARVKVWMYDLSMYNEPYRLEVTRQDSMHLQLRLVQGTEMASGKPVFDFTMNVDSLLKRYPDDLFTRGGGTKASFLRQWQLDSVAFDFVRSKRLYLNAICLPRPNLVAQNDSLWGDTAAHILLTVPYMGLEKGEYWTGMY